MNTEKETLALANHFFSAIERGDLDELKSLYAPHAIVWHNIYAVEITAEESLKSLAGFFKRVRDRRYENRRLNAFPGGFVQQHLLTATRADGKYITIEACVVARVENGRIVRLDEYVDSTAVAPWL